MTETWLHGKIHKEKGIRSIFNNHCIRHTDGGTSLAQDGEQIKQ